MPRRKFQKAASRTKKEARENAARALQKTKAKVDIDAVSPLKGVTPSPLVADTYRRAPKTAPTSDRIPGYAPAKDIFHEHKWKEPKKRRLLSAKCAGKPGRSVRPTTREHFNTFRRGSTAMSGLQEKAPRSGSDHVPFTETHRAQSASH